MALSGILDVSVGHIVLTVVVVAVEAVTQTYHCYGIAVQSIGPGDGHCCLHLLAGPAHLDRSVRASQGNHRVTARRKGRSGNLPPV